MVNETGKVTGIPQGGEEENFESYEQLLDQYGARKFAEGEVMKGTVLKITDTDVIVDIGYKSEGVIPVAQFIEPGGHVTISVGDVIDVLLEDTEDGDGHIVLSKEKAEKVKVWEDVEKAYNDSAIIRGRVIERIKGGLSVDIGIPRSFPDHRSTFVPSRISIRSEVKRSNAASSSSIASAATSFSRARSSLKPSMRERRHSRWKPCRKVPKFTER